MNRLMIFYFDPDPAGATGGTVIDAAATPVVIDATKPGSSSTTLDINKVDPPVVKVEPFLLPDAYKDKPYLKGAKDINDVYKMLDGAQELIGKKGSVLPKDDAPQSEWDAYYESVGRPKTAAEYVLKDADKTDPDFLKDAQEAMYKKGLSAKQAAGLWDDLTGALTKVAEKKGLSDQQTNVDFDKLAADTFGVDRDKVLARSRELLNANISPAMKAAIDKLPNESLIILADVLRNVDKKYISPDGPGAKPNATGATPDDLRMQARQLMEKQTKMDTMSSEYAATQKQIDAIYETIRRGTR